MGVCCCVNYSSSRSRRREQPLWNDFKWNVPPGGKQLPSSPAGEGFPPGSTRAVISGEAAQGGAHRAPRPAPRSSHPLLLGAAQNPRLTAPRTRAQVPGPVEADEELADLLASPGVMPGAGGRAQFSVSLVFSSVPGKLRKWRVPLETTCFIYGWAG